MKTDKSVPDNPSQEGLTQTGDSGNGLAVGLSLGVLVGIIIDNIGLGMMIGVAGGLCGGSAIGVLRKNKKAEARKDNDERR